MATNYSAFGKAQIDASSSIRNNLRFAGQYFDEETGLHDNWHRYYDPNSGRYFRHDPLGMAGGINIYSFVKNNPINRIDPNGLKTTFSMHTVGGGTIGAFEAGLAIARTKNKNGKCYEATYIVGGAGLVVGFDLKVLGEVFQILQMIGNTLKNETSLIKGSTFSTEDNYPPSSLTYLDVEGFSVSALYSAKLVDIEFSPYNGGRKPTDDNRNPIGSYGFTGDIGIQITKASGTYLLRWGEPREVCCNE